MIGKTATTALVCAAAMAAGLLASAGQAQAAIYTATYSGVVKDLLADGTYAHNLDGTDVTPGAAFTAVFRWNEADADPATSFDLPPQGSGYGGPMTGALTIGASSFAFQAPEGVAAQTNASPGQPAQILHDLDTGFGIGALTREALIFDIQGGSGLLGSWDWRVPATYDLTNQGAFGGFVFSQLDGQGNDLGDSGAELTPTSLVIAREGDVSAAPEPAAWTLMICGFGLAGATQRLRRRRLAAGLLRAG